ncbi:hypothetical protein CSB07_00405 [Candidatus Gracilibacteria bacterium]|nr:MAG: hypothetical protein CSB07_00405 [Candidatus Gracilibacteria bacterium]PIE85115.1 MAG: hypothetical protein CSA08_03660 [Candidatus Gracilibacteria bacterium]
MKKVILKIIYNVLAFFTRLYIYRTKPEIIGITGSVGKTSCRMIIFQVLKKHLNNKVVYTSPKNFNSELGFVFSIFKIEKFNPHILSLFLITIKVIYKSLFSSKKYDIILLEYGIDHPGDMDFLLKIAKPDIGIFTKLDSIHVENFSSKSEIGIEKFKLIDNAKSKVYLNFQDDFLREKFDGLKLSKDSFNKGDLKSKYILEKKLPFSEIIFSDKKIKTNILGNENFMYIQLAFDILNDYGIKINNNQEFLELENQAGRFSIFKGINNSVLIDSTYNAGFESMKKMINNTRQLQKQIYKDYKLCFVIGDMRELGKYAQEEHKKLFNEFDASDLLISVGKETKAYFPNNIKNFSSSTKAGLYLKGFIEKSKEKYLILFKGSQNTIFIEESLKQILLDKNDEKKLVRQNNYWLEKKKKYF